jgi:hypothetical protein
MAFDPLHLEGAPPHVSQAQFGLFVRPEIHRAVGLHRALVELDRQGLGARVAVLLGDDEIARSVATVRDMESGEQREVPIDRLAAALAP